MACFLRNGRLCPNSATVNRFQIGLSRGGGTESGAQFQEIFGNTIGQLE